MTELKFFNNEMLEYPNYLIIFNKHKLKKMTRAWHKFKRDMLIQNDIYIMMDDYNHRNDDRLIFYNNDKKYKTIYKRFNLNNKVLYIPIEEYSKYYLTFKTKLCTSIVETLGVASINFKHNEFTHTILNYDIHTSVNNLSLKTKVQSEEKDKYSNNDVKTYNKGHCNYLFFDPIDFEKRILELNSYFLDPNEFKNDLELRNLIRSRLIGNLIEYDLKYEFEFMNSIEVDLAASFMTNASAGINFRKMANKKLSVNLHIKFYNYSELINNDNIRLNERCLQMLVNNDNESQPISSSNLNLNINTEADTKINQNNDNNNRIDESEDNKFSNLFGDEDNNQNLNEMNQEDRCELSREMIRKKNNKSNLLNSFIDRYIEKYHHDKLFNYKMIKIADQSYLNNLIKNVKTLEDLSKNGFFINSFTGMILATLLTFDDTGLDKIQRLYIWIKRLNPAVEKIHDLEITEEDLTHYNISSSSSSTEDDQDYRNILMSPHVCHYLRCNEKDCNNPLKTIKTVMCYVIRVFNHENPDDILTHGLTNSPELMKVLRYIAMNLKHFTNYKMFASFTTKEIVKYRHNIGYYSTKKAFEESVKKSETIQYLTNGEKPSQSKNYGKNNQLISVPKKNKEDNESYESNESNEDNSSYYKSDNSSEISETDSYQRERDTEKDKERKPALRILAKRNSKSNNLPKKTETKTETKNEDDNDNSGFAYFMNSTFFS
jgi:hypothetical protein